MKRPHRYFFAPILLGLAALAASPASLTDENENYRQLQAMPRERRLVLLENLSRFEKLPPAEQKQIRRLNAEIIQNEPEVQRRYLSTMRRYQLWVNGLSEEKQEALRSTEDPDARFKLALDFRKQEQTARSASHRLFGIRTGYYNLMAPYEVAQLLRIWQKMTPAERRVIENRDGKRSLQLEIRDFNKNYLIKPHPFPADQDKHYDDELNGNKDFKDQLLTFARRHEAATKEETGKARSERHGFTIHFTEFRYFEDHPPRPVSQQNLEKFSSFCPAWFHAMMDPLSAEDARNYLTIVYRLLFPAPEEINANWKPYREKAAAASGGVRQAPKRGPSGPL